MRRIGRALLLAGMLGPAGALAQAPGLDEARPRLDPFARPPLERTPQPAGREAPARDEADWAPVLRGTLVAGSNSVADLGGVVLRIGEGYRGWRLVEVRTWEAVFERDGGRVVLPLAEEDLP